MKQTNRRSQAGFTLTEVIIVCVIIGILLAVATPGIVRYIRVFELSGALNNLGGQMQAARNRAVMKNVNIGVLWAITDNRTSLFVVEDDLRPNSGGGTDWWIASGYDWNIISADRVQVGGQSRTINRINFRNPQDCGAGGAGNRWAIRFNRLGAACGLPNPACGPEPQNPPGGQRFIYADAAGKMTVCLRTNAGLQRVITIEPGGRVRVMPGFK